MELLTVREAADLLRLSAGAVYALCKSGALPHHRLGRGRGAIRIDRQDLLRYAEACKSGGAAPAREGGPAPPPAPAGTSQTPRPGAPFKHLRVGPPPGPRPRAGGRPSGRGGRSAR